MSEARKRKLIAIYVDDDDNKDIEHLKQLQFYNKPYSELYRYLIRLGLQKAKEG